MFWRLDIKRFGRRKGYLATALFTGIFGVVSALSQNFVSMLILRGLLGFGIGGSPVAFSFLAEFLPRSNRGSFLIFFEAFWTLGTIVEVFLAWAILPSLGWRTLLIASSVPLWLLLGAYPWLPESPRYLLISGDYNGAVNVLSATAVTNKISLPKNARLAVDFKEDHRGSVAELINPGIRRLSLLLWILWVVHAVLYYGNVLFTPKFYGSHLNDSYPSSSPSTPIQQQNNNGEDSSPSESKMISSSLFVFVLLTTVAELPGLAIAAFLVERLGRKKTIAAMLSLCVVAVSGLFFSGIPKFLGICLLAVSRMGINGALATLWTYTPEAYPTTLRATGLGVANGLSKLATTGTPFISTALPDNYLWVAILVFTACCIIGIATALMLPFDTKDSVLASTVGAVRGLTRNMIKPESENMDEEDGRYSHPPKAGKEEIDENEDFGIRGNDEVQMDSLGIQVEDHEDDDHN